MRRGRPRKLENGRAARPFAEQTLAERGWTKQQSANMQRLAAIPDDAFEAILDSLLRQNKRLCVGAVLRRWYNLPPRARPASVERMAAALRAEGWTVIPPDRLDKPRQTRAT